MAVFIAMRWGGCVENYPWSAPDIACLATHAAKINKHQHWCGFLGICWLGGAPNGSLHCDALGDDMWKIIRGLSLILSFFTSRIKQNPAEAGLLRLSPRSDLPAPDEA